jgi:methyltransferase (TIGR00027 family)
MLTVADTAFSIAVVRSEEVDLPVEERLFEDPYARLFLAAGAHAAEGTERFLSLPFFREGVRLRTRFIDDALRAGLAAGLRQVVLLGAGFDARGLRMPEIEAAGATVFEVDFAAQLESKRALLAAAGVPLPARIAYVPCDFATPDFDAALAARLEERGFRPGAGAFFVWEGVIGYIDDAAIDRSLGFMVRAGGPGSRLVFTFGFQSFDPGSALERTRRAGFTTCEEVGADEVCRRYLPTPPHPYAHVARLGTAVV